MSSETLTTPLSDELDAFFESYVSAGQARGLAYGIVGRDGLVHGRGFGFANDGDARVDEDTVFPIASMSKSFLACSAMVAADRKLLDLEARITEYIPEFKVIRTAAVPSPDVPTMRQLLGMGGGLTEDNAWVDPFISTPIDDLLQTIAAGVRLSRPPGVSFEYSNLGFTLAGLAVGRATGQRIETWVRSELLTPLGLDSTMFDNQEPETSPHRAAGYTLDERGGWVAYPRVRSDSFAAAGGMVSTVRDLAHWVTWLAAAFEPETESRGPASAAARRELQRIQYLDLPGLLAQRDGSWRVRVAGYGLGLGVVEDVQYGTLVSHSGGLPGFKSNMTWHPSSGHGIVVLTNSHRSNPAVLAEQALFMCLDHHVAPARSVPLWPEALELKESAERLVRSWDDDLAARLFAENVDFDRPLEERREEIEQLVELVGPLRSPRPAHDIVDTASPAHVTWVVDGERGELLCRLHLTPTARPRIQELSVQAQPYDRPRTARRGDLGGHTPTGRRSLTSAPNTAVSW